MPDIPPYFTAHADAVKLGPWFVLVGEEWVPLRDHVPDWDYNTAVRLRRSARVDPERFFAATRLPRSTSLVWAVTWRSTDTWLAGLALKTIVDFENDTLLVADLPPQELGAAIELSTRIVLPARRSATGSGQATDAGSILFSETRRLAMLGSAGQFPIAVLDFAEADLDVDASFVVHMSNDLSSPVLGGLLLLVNSRDSRLVDALQSRSPSGELQQLRYQLEETLASSLLRRAAAEAAQLLDGEWEDESIGALLQALATASPGGLAALRSLEEQNPSGFEARLVGLGRRRGIGRPLR